MDAYLSPAEFGQAVFKSKGSKFTGLLYPIADENESIQILQKVRKDTNYRGACHFCYARILGKEQRVRKSSDDGEPLGTAGKPILHQLENAGLTQCMLIVVRFFGGVLLGKGGLIQSYRETARIVIQNTPVKSIPLSIQYRLSFRPEQLSMVEKCLRNHQAEISGFEFEGSNCWTINIKPSLSESFENSMAQLSYLEIMVEKSA